MSDCTVNLLNGDICPVSRKVKKPTLKLPLDKEGNSMRNLLLFVIARAL